MMTVEFDSKVYPHGPVYIGDSVYLVHKPTMIKVYPYRLPWDVAERAAHTLNRCPAATYYVQAMVRSAAHSLRRHKSLGEEEYLQILSQEV